MSDIDRQVSRFERDFAWSRFGPIFAEADAAIADRTLTDSELMCALARAIGGLKANYESVALYEAQQQVSA